MQNRLENGRNDKFIQAALFLLAACLAAVYIRDIDPIYVSGDAASIWTAIKAMANGEMVGSYVMYKGVLSCYPYVWFYQLSQMLQLSEFFFVKVYHILLFAYAAAIGLPNIFERLFQQKVHWARKLLLIVVLFLIWKSTYAIDQMMVDLPSMACFVASVSSALNWNAAGRDYPKWRVLLLAFLLGCGFCFSGQYSIATFFLTVYCAIVIFNMWKAHALKSVTWMITLLGAVVLMALPKAANHYFMETVVAPLVEAGAWIPDGSVFLIGGLTKGSRHYSMFFPELRSPLGERIYGVMQESEEISNGSILAVVGVWVQYPLEMLQLWCNRLFMALSIEGTVSSNGSMYHNAVHLFIDYLALYVTILVGVRKIRRWKDIFCRETLIFVAFLFTILVSCALHMESRFALSIHGLVITIGLLNDTVWDGLKAVAALPRRIKEKDERLSAVNWAVIGGAFFVLVCFIHYGTLMELQALDNATDFFYHFKIW